MNGDFQFLDIIFFAVVAAFLVLRLRGVLGKRTGNERPPQGQWNRGPMPHGDHDDTTAPAPDAADNVIDLGRARKAEPVEPAEPLPPGPLGEGLAAIRAVDADFQLNSFLSGARMAFEMVVQAYAADDLDTLRPLLSNEVYGPFAAAIEQRQRQGHILGNELMGIREVEAVDARLNGPYAEIGVRFVSEQVSVVKDGEGHILEGDPNRIITVNDIWTFRRDTRSNNPNWQLVATRSAEEPGA